MAEVSADDDSVPRWVVWHYRYDADRRERRNVAVAAFDNPDEFHADIEQRSSQLRSDKESGAVPDAAERISGRMYEPGYLRLQQNAHLLKRAIEHGVAPAGIDDMELPSNVTYIRAERQ
jgi:hypothetical protein